MAALTAAGRLQVVDEQRLAELLEAAFDLNDLAVVLQRQNRKLGSFVAPGSLPAVAMTQVVAAANRMNWWPALLAGARRERPDDPQLMAFAVEFSLAPVPMWPHNGTWVPMPARELEAQVRAGLRPMDVAVWRTRLGEIESRVCRVECPAGTPRGTGFLVGPNAVITNYHVMEPLFDHAWSAEDVVLRFDYKVRPGGVAVDEGTPERLAPDWRVHHSRYSPLDLQAVVDDGATPQDLDYALLRTQGRPGDKRGVIAVPPAAMLPDIALEKALYIVQHPTGSPMQVAFDTESIIGRFGQGSRLRYRTNTEPGSSGSPCFGQSWQWLALHHSGDPMYLPPGTPARYNQGIWVPAIVEHLRANAQPALGGLV